MKWVIIVIIVPGVVAEFGVAPNTLRLTKDNTMTTPPEVEVILLEEALEAMVKLIMISSQWVEWAGHRPPLIPGTAWPRQTRTLPKCVRCTMRTISELLPRRPIINQNLQVSLFHSKSLNLMKKTCHLKRITPQTPLLRKTHQSF